MSTRVKIQQAILAAVKGRNMPTVQYDPGTSLGSSGVSVPLLAPASAYCNEIGSTFELSEKEGRTFKAQRVDWSFELLVEYLAEVELESLVDSFCKTPPKVDAGTPGKPSIFTMILQSYVVEHPPQQQPNLGTRVQFIFTAIIPRN